jgi:hypothetical protein
MILKYVNTPCGQMTHFIDVEADGTNKPAVTMITWLKICEGKSINFLNDCKCCDIVNSSEVRYLFDVVLTVHRR